MKKKCQNICIIQLFFVPLYQRYKIRKNTHKERQETPDLDNVSLNNLML